jgi:hypothetical protein
VAKEMAMAGNQKGDLMDGHKATLMHSHYYAEE